MTPGDRVVYFAASSSKGHPATVLSVDEVTGLTVELDSPVILESVAEGDPCDSRASHYCVPIPTLTDAMP